MGKRCICGKSERFPLCDGTHRALGWTCDDAHPVAARAFAAGRHNENLAERLASDLGGVAVHGADGVVRAAQLVAIVDATSVGEVHALSARVEAASRRVVAIDLEASLAASLFAGGEVVSVASEPALQLWRSVRAAVTGEAKPVVAERLVPAFVSHAVADEPAILPAIAYLREHAGADLFVCADSIAIGSRWFEAIVAELERRTALVWLLSRHAARSTFCAFEIGFAMAKEARVVVVSLDGERPPSFAQHLHAIDLERRAAARPWLDRHELLTESIVDALREAHRSSP